MAKQKLTQAEWVRRARALAREMGTVGKARKVGTNYVGATLYKVPSMRDGGGCFLVHIWPGTGAATCDCTPAVFGRPCSHAGAVLLEREAERQQKQRAEASTPATSTDWYRQYLREEFPTPGFVG